MWPDHLLGNWQWDFLHKAMKCACETGLYVFLGESGDSYEGEKDYGGMAIVIHSCQMTLFWGIRYLW